MTAGAIAISGSASRLTPGAKTCGLPEKRGLEEIKKEEKKSRHDPGLSKKNLYHNGRNVQTTVSWGVKKKRKPNLARGG